MHIRPLLVGALALVSAGVVYAQQYAPTAGQPVTLGTVAGATVSVDYSCKP